MDAVAPIFKRLAVEFKVRSGTGYFSVFWFIFGSFVQTGKFERFLVIAKVSICAIKQTFAKYPHNLPEREALVSRPPCCTITADGTHAGL